MSRKTVVYIACPMTKGNWTANVQAAARVSRDLMRKGYCVFNPTGSWLADLVEKTEPDVWIENDFGLIAVSDCILRLPGESEGADRELDFAARNGCPIFLELGELYRDMPNEMEQE